MSTKEFPKVFWRYGRPENPEDDALVLCWINPWDGKEETIAYFLWPAHPPEKTEAVEAMFETIAAFACQNSASIEAALREARAEERNRMLTILQSTITEEQLDLLLLAEGIDPQEALEQADGAISRAIEAARAGTGDKGDK